GDVVVDIGAGTGILSLLACRAGARRVFAIEHNDAIAVAKKTAEANGFSDRITFIQDLSTRVSLPEKANVLVSDIHGVLPGFENQLDTIIDARDRFLADGGHLIPSSDSLMAAAVSDAKLHSRHACDPEIDGLDLRAARELTVNAWSQSWLKPNQLISEPCRWKTLDYRTIEKSVICADFELTFDKDGVAHGLGVWFDSVLAEGVELSNAPAAPDLVYGNGFFPWPEPVEVSAGDVARIFIQANPIQNEHVWRWETRILSAGREDRLRQQFSQSTFFGAAISSHQLKKGAPDYVPKLTEEGEMTRTALELMADGLSVGEAANRMADRFPNRFPDWKIALDFISTLSRKYS
ncbi:MAG: 50S ribosomal protein L11 methyltransferase, partial [Gammaproteobacteria bacterium]|nr:50S ribosomal protein L11 methyltransferase [Gammaproteobacteria bacterium]